MSCQWQMAMEGDAGRGYCHAKRESTLKHVLCGGSFLTRPPTGTPKHTISPGEGLLFPSLHHHTFSPKGVAGLSFTTRIGRAISLLFTRIQRGGWCDLHCAHRATTASSWGLCEHRDHARCLASPLLRSLVSLFKGRSGSIPYCAHRPSTF